MPALDDHIDDLFETYFYHITTPQKWEEIRREGLRPDRNGTIPALTTNRQDIIEDVAWNRMGIKDFVVIRFNPCNLGLYPKAASFHEASSEQFMTEIKAVVIGPLWLEIDSERKISRT